MPQKPVKITFKVIYKFDSFPGRYGRVPYRNQHKETKMKKLALMAAVMLSTALASTAADPAISYKGNPDSKVFHKSSCHHATNVNCTATFTTREAAVTAGYTPCKVCKP